VKNELGWVGERDGISDDYVIQAGDEGFFNVRSYYHGKCNRENMTQGQEKRFRSIFEKAGFKVLEMTAIPNEYCPCEYCAPWFLVKTEFGTIKIGWRKQVINISIDTSLNFIELFKDEDVTKGVSYIHAWGNEKAQEYLVKIFASLKSLHAVLA
jgi:hypothetical protein